MAHLPVLLAEVLDGLALDPGDDAIDGTLGDGGHAAAILKQTAPDGRLLGIDLDPDARRAAAERLKPFEKRTVIAAGNYADMAQLAAAHGFRDVAGIVLDVGIRSEQLEESGRGFSFKRDEPLRMTFSPDADTTAAELVNGMSEVELTRLLREYGEERHALAVAKAIVRRRRKQRILTTTQLVEIIGSAVPAGYRRAKLHFATRTFQALRIAVNGELENLDRGLAAALTLLAPGGRLAVISFHSLEDRIVKHAFQRWTQEGRATILTKKPLTATPNETKTNPRSRSAKLRVAEKIS
ncbi:16S rRNA (cytosine(1402)-N(4))-methyltransferase RsmH [Patescibacteria group bacterium]|nr:MAG: 16S rRNA (cytosine(1402)-N(4))-methyltransferase RsmH [Patescibacteria group bacterium]